MNASIKTVTVYIKEDCHLCEDMLSALSAQKQNVNVGNDFILELRDIEDNPYWFDRYREYVPVLIIDEKEVCHYFFDLEEFNEALQWH